MLIQRNVLETNNYTDPFHYIRSSKIPYALFTLMVTCMKHTIKADSIEVNEIIPGMTSGLFYF